MPFLRVNGWDVPVADGQASVSFEKLGAAARSYSGKLRGTRRAKVRQWDISTVVQESSVGVAFEALCNGDGNVWSFDNDLYSSKGIGPDPGYSVTVSAVGGKYGGHVTVNSGTNLTYSVGLGQVQWTVLVWKEVAGTWWHYGLNSNGAQFKDGAPHTPTPGVDDVTDWLTASTISTTLHGRDLTGANANAGYDDLAIMPYIAPDAQILAVRNLGLAHPRTPEVLLSGDILDGPGTAPIYVIGDASSTEFVQAQGSAGWRANYREVTVRFSEVVQQGRQ